MADLLDRVVKSLLRSSSVGGQVCCSNCCLTHVRSSSYKLTSVSIDTTHITAEGGKSQMGEVVFNAAFSCVSSVLFMCIHAVGI